MDALSCRKFHKMGCMNEWISVKDRLPDDCDNVLIYAEGMCVTGAFLIYDRDKNPICWTVNDWDESDSTIRTEYVTHWMPFPSTDSIAKNNEK